MKAIFTIKDADREDLEVSVEQMGSFLNIWPKGYGNCVSLEWYKGKLRLLVNNEEDRDGPPIIMPVSEDVKDVY